MSNSSQIKEIKEKSKTAHHSLSQTIEIVDEGNLEPLNMRLQKMEIKIAKSRFSPFPNPRTRSLSCPSFVENYYEKYFRIVKGDQNHSGIAFSEKEIVPTLSSSQIIRILEQKCLLLESDILTERQISIVQHQEIQKLMSQLHGKK